MAFAASCLSVSSRESTTASSASASARVSRGPGLHRVALLLELRGLRQRLPSELQGGARRAGQSSAPTSSAARMAADDSSVRSGAPSAPRGGQDDQRTPDQQQTSHWLPLFSRDDAAPGAPHRVRRGLRPGSARGQGVRSARLVRSRRCTARSGPLALGRGRISARVGEPPGREDGLQACGARLVHQNGRSRVNMMARRRRGGAAPWQGDRRWLVCCVRPCRGANP